MSTSKGIRFNWFVLGLFCTGLALTSLVVFTFSYYSALSISQEQMEGTTERDLAVAKLTFERHLADFETRLRSASVDSRLVEAVRSDERGQARQILLDLNHKLAGASFDVLFLDFPNDQFSLNLSEDPGEAEALFPVKHRIKMLPDLWGVQARAESLNDVVYAAISIPLHVHGEEANLHARLIGGIKISGGDEISAIIADALQADTVEIMIGNTMISRVTPAMAITDPAFHLPFTRANEKLSFSVVLLDNPNGAPLVAQVEMNARPATKVQAAYANLLVPFLATVLMAGGLACFWLYRMVTPALTYLISHAHELRQGRTPDAKQKSSIQEFNTLATLFNDAFETNRRTDAQFRELIDGSLQGVFVHANKHILYVNDALMEMLGYGRGAQSQLIGKPVLDLYAKEEHRQLNQFYNFRSDGSTAPRIYEARAQREDGSVIWLEQHVRTISWNGEEAFYATALDITDRKRKEQQASLHANYDPITGLPNRYLFLDRLKHAAGRSNTTKERYTVLLIEVDRFQTVKKTFGQEFGDLLLANIAWRIQEIIGPSETAAWLGGNQFGLILNSVQDDWDAEQKALGLLEAVAGARPTGTDTGPLVTAAIGIAMGPSDGDTPDTLMRHAEFAMHQAKAAGGNCCQFYNSETNKAATRVVKLGFALKSAIENNKLRLHYQPIVDFSSGKIISCEALLRWTHEDFGEIPPSEFIPIAEDTGMIVPLGDWVLNEACRFFVDCKKRGLDLQCISVNVSPRQCRDGSFVSRVAEIIKDTGISPDNLHLEITETVMMDDSRVDPAMILDALRDIGIKLSLDDFGTGYSSLSYLKRLPIDILKIDRSFILDLEEDPDDQTLIRAILSMAKSLGIEVICEGAETGPQCQILSDLGCQLIQGYHIAKPMPGWEFVRFLRTNAMAIPPQARLH